MEANKKIKVLAPLSEFRWDGNNYKIHNLCVIKRIINYCPYGFKRALSKDEKNSIKSCSYWLEMWQSKVDTLSARKKINAFLLLLWLQKPTKTHVKIFFENGKKL